MSPSQNIPFQSRIVHLGSRKTALLPNDYLDVKLSPDCNPDQTYILQPSVENLVNSWFPQHVQAVGNTLRISNVSQNPILILDDTHILRVITAHDKCESGEDPNDDKNCDTRK